METAILLNINAKKSKANDSLTGKTSAVDYFAVKKADSFKSAYKSQVNKRSEEKSSEINNRDKNLPHSGNGLPDKKLSDDKQKKDSVEKATVGENTEPQKNNTHKSETKLSQEDENATAQEKDSDSHAEAGTYEEENESTQTSNFQQQNNLDKNDSIDEQDELLDAMTVGIDQNNSQSKTASTGNTTSEAVNPGIIATDPMVKETVAGEALTTKDITPGSMISGLSNVDNYSTDKKNQPESLSGQKNIFQSLSLSQNNIESDAKAGSGGKNDSSLGKSVADFQFFIEMSKKHSDSGEAIASVKGFQENMKAEQLSTQIIRNEIKLPTAQDLSPAQLAMQTVSTERLNPVGNVSPTAILQSLPSLEVRNTVGKPGWNKGFSQQIIMMAHNGIHQAKIKLNPVHLGPVEAMVKLNGETAVVNLTSLHLTTKEAMDNATPRLKEMLNENGFSQVDVNVSHQDKKEQQEANLSSNKERSNSEHGNSTMPGEEQLSEVNPGSDPDELTTDSDDQGLNIVDYYA